MRPNRPAQSDAQDDLFRSELKQMISPNHELVRLSERIPWDTLDRKFGAYYVEKQGCPGKPTRLMAGLQYLKTTYNLSDEELIDRWLENPYWQYFCGAKYFQHQFPIHPTSLTKWRQRVGESGMETLLAATIETGLRCKAVAARSLEKVNVDTTVQEKNITYPTDAKLLNRVRAALVTQCDYAGVVLRQRYPKVAKRLVMMASRYFHARQTKRARACVKKLRTLVGRIIRDIERKIEGRLDLIEYFKTSLALARRILDQKRNDSKKVYSVHALEVECIAKGKAHKKYEFGNKVGIVATSREGFVIGAKGFHGNPHDSKTLQASLDQAAALLDKPLAGDVFVDRGYRGHDYDGPAQVHIAGKRKLTSTLKKWMKRRPVIEATIGHMKQSHRLNRNYLKGKVGDCMNVIASACGWNLHLILAKLRLQGDFLAFFQWVTRHPRPLRAVLQSSTQTAIHTLINHT